MSRHLRSVLLACLIIAGLSSAAAWAATHHSAVRPHKHHARHKKAHHKKHRRHRDHSARKRPRRHHTRPPKPPRHTPPTASQHVPPQTAPAVEPPPPSQTPPSPPEPPSPPDTPAPPADPATVGPLDVVSPFPANQRLFSPTSVWNAALADNAARDPRSASLTGALAEEVHREMDDRSGPWINTSAWSVADYTVGSDVPTDHVTLDAYDPDLQDAFDAVPMPTDPKIASGYDGSLGDGQLVIYQPSTDTLWEFWLLEHRDDGWHARWGGKMTHVSENPGYFPAPYGASGTSLPLLGGLMTVNELEAGQIDHALAIALPNTSADEVTPPAQRGDGQTRGAGAIPEGTHFRIDPSVDLSTLNLSPTGLAIARAAQRYGFVVRDTSSCVVFYAEDPRPGGSDPYGRIFGGQWPIDVLAGFPWDRLQVVAPGG